jgi:hypothetical protein
VLHKEWRVLYVGRVIKDDLGSRLKTHYRRDWLAGRWDRFSWYGTRGVNKDGTLSKEPLKKNVSTETVIATLEALLISVAEGLNRAHATLPGGVLISQALDEAPKPLRTQLEDLRTEIEYVRESLDELVQQG